MDPLNEEVIASESLYEGKLIDLRRDTVRLPNGETSSREIVTHPGAVAMVPLLDSGEVVLVRQFRLAANRQLLEIPAGTLKPGEDPRAAAERELQEEIGFRPGKLEELGNEYTAPGYTTELIHLYLATGLQASRLTLDEDEFVEIVTLPLDEALHQVESGAITDGKTLIGLLLVARRLGR